MSSERSPWLGHLVEPGFQILKLPASSQQNANWVSPFSLPPLTRMALGKTATPICAFPSTPCRSHQNQPHFHHPPHVGPSWHKPTTVLPVPLCQCAKRLVRKSVLAYANSSSPFAQICPILMVRISSTISIIRISNTITPVQSSASA
jgi:hypothetical protein